MNKYSFEITNKNEITKSDFDQLDSEKNFDKFTNEQIEMSAANIYSLIKKGETEELAEEELDLIKSGTAELNKLTKYIINENISGRIVKSNIFVLERQVQWEDTLEKSITNDPIQKGIFLDTELNRELDRVGEVFYKGKRIPKKAPKELSEDEKKEKDDMEGNDMYKACMDSVKKGEGTDKEALYKSMTEKYPDMDSKKVKNFMNNVYKAVSESYLKKADDYANMSKDKKETED